MGFFAEFMGWLNRILEGYITSTTATVAAALEPLIVILATLYIVVWGYLHLMGRIEEPFATGVRRIFLLATVLGLSLSLWYYNELIVDTFFLAPSSLAAHVIGANDAIAVVDGVLAAGNEVATSLTRRAAISVLKPPFYIAALGVQIIVGVTAVYTMFLMVLSKIALSVLLALGPFFIGMLFFESTKKFFESWISQLANYAFITILTALIAAVLLTVITRVADQVLTTGGNVQVADAVRLCVAAGLTLLVMRQVTPIAASLSHGVALSSFGVIRNAIAWGMGTASRNTQQFGRGLMDRETGRIDSLSRKAGYYSRQGLSRSARALWNVARRPNSIRPA